MNLSFLYGLICALAGYPPMLKHYRDRTNNVLHRISKLSSQVLPCARFFVDKVMGSGVLMFLESPLVGTYDAQNIVAWDDELFGKLKNSLALGETLTVFWMFPSSWTPPTRQRP